MKIFKTDEKIKKDIIEELQWTPNVTETDIGVTVRDGIVTLSGTVPNFAEKFAAEQAALRVEGVRAVVERIEVKFFNTLDDADIARAVSNALETHVSLPKDIHITVEDGRVTLKGTVEQGYLRTLAHDAIRYITGVRDINNHIIVKPSVQPQDVKRCIKDALRRIAEADADRVHIETVGGNIVLTGNVGSLAEMEDIKWAAWAAPGVMHVENKMTLVL